jgi:NAD-dependent SIR2 family protein deacetylase
MTERLESSVELAHGFLPQQAEYASLQSFPWPMPVMTAKSEQQARPGYDSCRAHEYNDEPEVLREKIKFLAHLIKKSSNFVVYSGAGISTASGIGDYASRAENSAGITNARPQVWSEYDANPTYAHRAISQLYNAGYLKHWVQQNHDGLPQKAGFPQHEINEIHGGWYDPSNPVIPMTGSLRSDFFEWLLEWERKADLCLAVGTSLAGMNADRVAQATGKRLIKSNEGLGTVIINLQCTKSDKYASLRIFSTIDHAMELLVEELALSVPEYNIYSLSVEPEDLLEEDLFLLRHYGPDGKRLDSPASVETAMRLDLREDAEVKISIGMFLGHEGVITGKSRENHYRLRIMHPLKGTFKAPKVHTLGLWWIDAALKGTVPQIPIVNCGESLGFGLSK